MNIVYLAGFFILSFLCVLACALMFLHIGYRMAKGNEPPKIKSPVKAIREAQERKAVEDKTREEAELWQKIDEYDGYTEEERQMIKKVGDGD